MAFISQIKLSDTTYDISAIKLKNARTINGMSFNGTAAINNFGVCSTAADAAAKIVTVGSTFSLVTGAQVTVKFTNANSAASPTLSVNGTTAKPIYRYGTTAVSTSNATSGWSAGAVMHLTYDGTGWVRDYWANSTYYIDSVQCTTAAGTAAKTGSCSFYTLANNRYFICMIAYSNTYAGAITLNINSAGAKPIYINGAASSASNYTLPRGMYLVYYNGTNYYFRTDGNIQGGGFSGTASAANKLATARTISLTGAVTGSGTFDGTGNLSIATSTNHSHSYLPLSGGTMTGSITLSGGTTQIKKTGTSASWINGRDQAAVRITSYNAYNAGLSMKTTNGSWEIGVYTGDNMWFTYAPDSNYSSGTNTVAQFRAASNGTIYGAVWNDYAEFRICNEGFKAGQVVLENGDDTLSIASKRLQRGCSIVSDTFGFAIGETDDAKCPIAVSGRVLAYGYESREEFKKHIGWPVCSGPNGTVSIMTEEEEEKYPSRIIGTISAVPDYETWGTGNIEVNNRIWIKIK